MRQLSAAALAAMMAQETSEVFILLVTISHPSLTQPPRIASDPFELLPVAGVRGVVSRGEEYVFMPFDITLPSEDETGASRAKLSIDNVGRELMQAVRSAGSSLAVDIEIVLSSDVDTPELQLKDFRLERVTYDAFTVSGDITMEYFDLEPFPSRRFTPSDFPGLF